MGQQSEDAEDSRRRITGRDKGEKEWRENRERQEVESKTTRDDIIYKIKQETNIRCVKVISILTYLSQYRSIRSTDSILWISMRLALAVLLKLAVFLWVSTDDLLPKEFQVFPRFPAFCGFILSQVRSGNQPIIAWKCARTSFHLNHPSKTRQLFTFLSNVRARRKKTWAFVDKNLLGEIPRRFFWKYNGVWPLALLTHTRTHTHTPIMLIQKHRHTKAFLEFLDLVFYSRFPFQISAIYWRDHCVIEISHTHTHTHTHTLACEHEVVFCCMCVQKCVSLRV